MITESGEMIAVVANQIVTARHRLNPRQQQVINWAIAQIARDDSDFLTHTLSVSEFGKLTGSTSGSIFKEMEGVTTSLLREILETKEPGERSYTRFQWLSRCKYEKGNGTVEIRFHDELKPYLLELRTRFTQLRLERVFRLRSSYSIRFFERIEMQRGLNRLTWTMSLEELRNWLGVEPGAYKFFDLFRANILDVAQRELDARSDWSFSFLTMKTGRKITGVEFTLRPARSPKNNPLTDRWKKAPADLRARVLALAATKPRWEGKPAGEIEADSTFWQYLPDLFMEIEQGQKTLGLA